LVDRWARCRACLAGLAFLLAVLTVAPAAWAQAPAPAQQWEFFEINAQYRGGVKKGFDELGCAIGYFLSLPDGRRQAIMHACVKNPEKRNSFVAFRLNIVYSFANDRLVADQKVYAWFDGVEGEHQEQIIDLVMLLGIVRDGSINAVRTGKLQLNRNLVDIQGAQAGGGSRVEYLLTRPGNPPIGGGWLLDKFRFKRDKVSVSFVTAPAGEVQAKFQTVAPFSTVVFAPQM
jgi:hypothetical protein